MFESVRRTSVRGRVFLGAAILVALLLAALFFIRVSVPSAIVITSITVVLGFTTQLILSDRQNQRSIESSIREKNAESYKNFVGFWLDLLILPQHQRLREEGGMTKEFLVPKMNVVSQPLMLWSSNDFVRAYADFRRMLTAAERNKVALPPLETLFAFEDLLMLMRKDMGHDLNGVKRGDLLSFFVNDIENQDDLIGAAWALGQKPLGNLQS